MLCVGIMLDSYTSGAWVAKVIEDIQSSGFARLELVIINSHPEQRGSSFKARLRNRLRFTLFRLYVRNKAGHDAMASMDVSSLLSGVPSISVERALWES
jgi:hypothetical protein